MSWLYEYGCNPQCVGVALSEPTPPSRRRKFGMLACTIAPLHDNPLFHHGQGWRLELASFLYGRGVVAEVV